MNYGELLSEALRVSWRNRFLWLFGFFIAGGLGSAFSFVNPPQTVGAQPGSPPGWLTGLGRWLQENGVLAAVLVGALVLLGVLISVAISAFCIGALADSVTALRRGEARRFSGALRAGASNFFRVFLFAILTTLVFLGIFTLFSALAALPIVATFLATESAAVRAAVSIPVAALAFVLFLSLAVSLYVVWQLALRALVVGREGVVGCIGAGYGIFRRNLGRSLLAWLIQFAIAVGVTVTLFFVTLVLSLLQGALVAALGSSGLAAAAIAAAVITGLLFTVPLLLVYAFFGTFNHAYWTLAYLRLTEPPLVPTATPVPPDPGTEPTYG